MKRKAIAAIGLATLLLATAPAAALTPPAALEGEHGLRVASGPPARTARLLTPAVPARAAAAYARFRARRGEAWRGMFDSSTQVPNRIFGGSIPAPGSVASAASAEAFARAVLEEHLDLLAPGAKRDDFVLAANDLDSGLRTVAFTQHYEGLPVLGGQVSFRFKNDRLFVLASEAVPDVILERARLAVPTRDAEEKARAWIARDLGGEPKVSRAGVPLVLSIVRASGEIDHHRAIEVIVDSESPVARFSVYIDAETGALIARRQTLLFADGTLLMNTPDRNPEAKRQDRPGDSLRLVVGTATVTASHAGAFSWPGAAAVSVVARAVGPRVVVLNSAGPETSVRFQLQPGETFAWNASDDEMADAQLITYVATGQVKDRVKIIAPELTWIDTDQTRATVNMNGTCNAFSDGETINFFRAGHGCQNTGRIPDVVYHEFGHAVHAHAIIPGTGDFDGALSEGAADYLAGTITGDHGMGRGFLLDDRALRDLDPEQKEAQWPGDIAGDPHQTGLIFGGAMWDLRKALIEELGSEAAIPLADRLWYEALRRSTGIPSSYVEILAADDDDGDLGNGTPHLCAIHDAFEKHGLTAGAMVGPGIGALIADGLALRVPMSQGVQCPSTTVISAEVAYALRGDPSWSGNIPFAIGSGSMTATIPTPTRANAIVQYHVTITTQDGAVRHFPDNAADPDYEVYIGKVVPLYCTEFENDPSVEGWTHALLAGEAGDGADDWQWGAPQATAGSGDPNAAYSGTYVYGNDLGGRRFNGQYQAGKTNALTAPAVGTADFTHVRLQYRRWLNVEDGFYDRARILANDVEVWSNLSTNGQGHTNHEDREWRFHDVDLSSAVKDGQVVVKFELEANDQTELGGWTIDDFCIVGVDETARCGDGFLAPGETCDDGNTTDGDGCSATCTIEVPARCGDGKVDTGEACDDGNTADADGCSAACTIEVARCGDGRLDPGEACDDGALDGTACASGCVLPASAPAAAEVPAEGCGCASTRASSNRSSSGGGLLALVALGLTRVGRRRRTPCAEVSAGRCGA